MVMTDDPTIKSIKSVFLANYHIIVKTSYSCHEMSLKTSITHKNNDDNNHKIVVKIVIILVIYILDNNNVADNNDHNKRGTQ